MLIIPFTLIGIVYKTGPDKLVSCAKINSLSCQNIHVRFSSLLTVSKLCSCWDKAIRTRNFGTDTRNTATLWQSDVLPNFSTHHTAAAWQRRAARRTQHRLKQSDNRPQSQTCSKKTFVHSLQAIINNPIKSSLCASGQCHFLESTLTRWMRVVSSECVAAGCEPGAGDSGYQGTNPMAERASLFGPGAPWMHCPHILCSLVNYAWAVHLKSWASCQKPERAGLAKSPFFFVAWEGEWKRNIFTALKRG